MRGEPYVLVLAGLIGVRALAARVRGTSRDVCTRMLKRAPLGLDARSVRTRVTTHARAISVTTLPPAGALSRQLRRRESRMTATRLTQMACSIAAASATSYQSQSIAHQTRPLRGAFVASLPRRNRSRRHDTAAPPTIYGNYTTPDPTSCRRPPVVSVRPWIGSPFRSVGTLGELVSDSTLNNGLGSAQTILISMVLLRRSRQHASVESTKRDIVRFLLSCCMATSKRSENA
jgi:hypothetical protein